MPPRSPDTPVDGRLGERVATRIPHLLWALALAFAFFALLTALTRPPGATAALALIDGAGAFAFAVGAVVTRRRPPKAPNAVAAAALLATAIASLVAIKLLHAPAQTTNLLLLQLVASLFLLSLTWTLVVDGVVLVGWGVVASSEGLHEGWLNAGAALVVTTIMSVTIQLVRLRDARRTERLLLADHARTAQLERAIASERLHGRELASANRSLEAFSYIVSHDLKEPIRGMGFYLEEARRTQDPQEREELILRAIATHADLARLVLGLLEWSRATTTPVEPVLVDVESLLKERASRVAFEPLLQERRAKLLVESGLPPVLGTPPLVRQVLGNLILNAIRHNPREDAQVRIFAAPDAPEGKVDLIVEDNGPGFPPEMLRQDAHGHPRSVGRGFGLQIVRRAVERLGGEVHLGDREEGGARVHVVLPAARGPSLRVEPAPLTRSDPTG